MTASNGKQFGLDSGNTTDSGSAASTVQGMRFHNTCGTGKIREIELEFLDASPNGSVRLGVYADSSGQPGALIADIGTVAVANGFVKISSLDISIGRAVFYWLAYCMQSSNDVRYQSGQPSSSHCWSDVDAEYYSVGLPDPFPYDGGRRNDNQYVMRATTNVETCLVNAAGDETNCNVQPSGSNYEAVDEWLSATPAHDGVTSYVVNGTTGEANWTRDLYNIASLVDITSISKVTVVGYCRYGGAGTPPSTPAIKLSVKPSGGSVDEESEQEVTASYAEYTNEWSTNPDDSQAWEAADIASLQIGVNLERTYTDDKNQGIGNCTQIFLEVTEAEGGGQVYELSCTDGFKMGEPTVKASLTIGLSLTDGIKGGDTPVGPAVMQALSEDGLKIGDAPSVFKTLNLLLTDGVDIGDTPSTLAILNAIAADGLKVGDTSLAGLVYSLLAADGFKAGDSPVAGLLYQLLATDGFEVGDTPLHDYIANVLAADGVKVGDAPTTLAILNALATDGFKLGEYSISVGQTEENYKTGDDGAEGLRSLVWGAQSFTPSAPYQVIGVALKLYRSNSPGEVTVSIKATDGNGQPTGQDLCSGTTDGDTLTTDTAGEWREIYFGDGCSVSSSVKYAIVVRATDAPVGNLVYWRVDESSPTYEGGCYEKSGSGGAVWVSYPGTDTMFEVLSPAPFPKAELTTYQSLTDGVKIGDTPAAGLMYQLLATDGFKVGDVPIALAILNALAVDGVKIGDTPLTQAILQTIASDGFKVGDTTSVGKVLDLLVSDGLKLSDLPTVVGIMNLTLTDGFTLGALARYIDIMWTRQTGSERGASSVTGSERGASTVKSRRGRRVSGGNY